LILLLSFLFIFNNSDSLQTLSQKWDALDKKIVLKQIEDIDEAVEEINFLNSELKKQYYKSGGKDLNRSDWIFPLKNFTSVSHRQNGNDYVETSYDYFQGSNTIGHPAHDIMILDNDKDLLDDSTGKPVDIVSMSNGIVVATDTTWKIGSLLRGGKYVKIYDVTNNKMFYYSHLSTVEVKPGDIINAGDKLGEVGRTGRKTILPEGKTHLHVALLYFDEGYPVPEPIIKDIYKTKEKFLKENAR
jgi:peptidoglycan LD-endopeptidase LytH